MKKLQTFAATAALTLLLSASALADDGIIQTGLTSSPTTPPASSTTTTSDTDGIIQTGSPVADAKTTLTTVVSALVQGALAVA